MIMLEKYFKKFAEKLSYPLIKLCIALKIKPNTLSIIGLLIVIIGSVLVYKDYTGPGLTILFIGSAVDGLDGPLARITNQTSGLGDFIDSTVDRIAEMFIWCTFCLKFTSSHFEVMLVFGILTGSFLIPYTRAKAESIGIYENVGITPRPERVIFSIIYMALTPGSVYLYIFTFLVWLTVFQRINVLYRKI